MHLSFFNNNEFQWFFIKIINFLMSHYYLLKDNEDSSHCRTVICIILYSGNCLLYILEYSIYIENVSKINTKIFKCSKYTVIYESLGETLPLEIKVQIYQVMNWWIYFLERICQVNWNRRSRKGWAVNAYTLQVYILLYLNIIFYIFPLIRFSKLLLQQKCRPKN